MSAECQALLGDVHGVNVFINEGHHELEEVSAR